jgi:hypothetical protein
VISAGVPAGAPSPCQVRASKPGTNSPTVGTFGSASVRAAVVPHSWCHFDPVRCFIVTSESMVTPIFVGPEKRGELRAPVSRKP